MTKAIIEFEKPALVFSWLDEEKYAFEWKYENFKRVFTNDQLLKERKLEIETNQDSPLHSKWTIYIANGKDAGINSSSDQVVIFCKLNQIFAKDISEIYSQLSWKPEGGAIDLKADGYIKVGKSLRVRAHPMNHFESWYRYDENGAYIFVVQLSLFNSKTGSKVDLLENKLQTISVSQAKQKILQLFDTDSTEADLKIICSDKEEIRCHKVILSASSLVFKTMLESGLSEAKTGEVNVTDISGKVMKLLLHFIYTGKLKDYWRDPDIIVEFTYAVGKYQMKELLEFLDKVLGDICKDYDVGVLVQLQRLAGKLDLKKGKEELKEPIIKLAVSAENTDDILSIFE